MSLAASRWRRLSDRRDRRDFVEPIAQFRVARSPLEARNQRGESQRASERDLRQVECATHDRIFNLLFPHA